MKRGRLFSLCVTALLLVAVSFTASPSWAGEKLGALGRDDFLRPFFTEPLTAREAVPNPAYTFQDESPEAKSVFKAVVLSLLLPGMGELYAGGFASGKYFLFAESGLWLTFTSFEVYGRWVQNDARKFAGSHASVQTDGKDDLFFINIANFNNVYDYNEKKLRDRDLASLYDPNGPFFWQWDTEQSRTRFRDLRVKSDNILNNVRFVAAAIVVNHVASAINAARLAIGWNKGTSSLEWDVVPGGVGASPDPSGLVLTIRKSF